MEELPSIRLFEVDLDGSVALPEAISKAVDVRSDLLSRIGPQETYLRDILDKIKDPAQFHT